MLMVHPKGLLRQMLSEGFTGTRWLDLFSLLPVAGKLLGPSAVQTRVLCSFFPKDVGQWTSGHFQLLPLTAPGRQVLLALRSVSKQQNQKEKKTKEKNKQQKIQKC